MINNIQTQSYSGKKIDFIFSNAGLDEMIDYLERISGIPFDLDPHIKVQATYHMEQVPWDQALAAILADNQLRLLPGKGRIKIHRGELYVLAFTDRLKAKILVFLYQRFHLIIISLFVLAAGLIGFRLMRKSRIRHNRAQRKELLDREPAEKIEKELSYLLEVKKIYRDEKLTLLSLSERLKITPHQLSWVINQKMKKSFPSLINLYRVEEVKKRLADSSQNEAPILQSAFEAGFSTKAAFNKSFKKMTGLTPSQYRDKHLGKDTPSSDQE